MAQEQLVKLLSRPPPPMTSHPGATAVVRFVSQLVKSSVDQTVLLHAMAFLQTLWPALNSSMASVVSALDQLMARLIQNSFEQSGSLSLASMETIQALMQQLISAEVNPSLLF